MHTQIIGVKHTRLVRLVTTGAISSCRPTRESSDEPVEYYKSEYRFGRRSSEINMEAAATGGATEPAAVTELLTGLRYKAARSEY